MYDPLRSCRGPMPVLVCALAVSFGSSPGTACAKDGIEAAGDTLKFVLPGTAAGLTLLNKDGKAPSSSANSPPLLWASLMPSNTASMNGAQTAATKCFPSGHTAISFSAAEFMRKGYGWEYCVPGCLRLQASEAHSPDITNVILTNQQIAVVHHGNLAYLANLWLRRMKPFAITGMGRSGSVNQQVNDSGGIDISCGSNWTHL